MRVYLDNAATTAICDEVLEVMLPFLKNNFGNPSSSHYEGRAAKAAIEKARKQVAKALNAYTNELFFTSGGTEANNTAIKCSVRDLGVRRIITSPIEHSCVKQSVASFLGDQRVEVVYVELEKNGRANLESLKSLLKDSDQKTLVSLMHGNNELGTLNDISAISEICQEFGAFFHTDTVQTIGQMAFDLKKIKVNFLSGSAHKIYGPKGVGFLYINRDNPINPLIDGGGQERNLRAGTENVAGIVGLGKAMELAVEEHEMRHLQLVKLRKHFLNGLQKSFSNIIFNGDIDGQRLEKVINVSFETQLPPGMLLFRLDLEGISISAGSACNSGAVKASGVASFLNHSNAYTTARFSLSHKNTIEELDFALEKIVKVLS